MIVKELIEYLNDVDQYKEVRLARDDDTAADENFEVAEVFETFEKVFITHGGEMDG